MKILVRNLDRNLTEEDLYNLFQPFGKVETCDLVLDQQTGRSKGFGFVEMTIEREGREAIKKLNGKLIRGAPIRVKITNH